MMPTFYIQVLENYCECPVIPSPFDMPLVLVDIPKLQFHLVPKNNGPKKKTLMGNEKVLMNLAEAIIDDTWHEFKVVSDWPVSEEELILDGHGLFINCVNSLPQYFIKPDLRPWDLDPQSELPADFKEALEIIKRRLHVL